MKFMSLQKIKEAVPLPLVLHGASSVNRDDLAAAIELGIRKVNVSSLLKQAYFEALRAACSQVDDTYNPYKVVGSGLDGDITTGKSIRQGGSFPVPSPQLSNVAAGSGSSRSISVRR